MKQTQQLKQVKKNLNFSLRLKRYWQLYIFLLIPVVYVILFKYVPMAGIQIAFKDFKASQGIFGSEWVGLKHFQKFFSSYQFKRILPNTLILSLYSLIAGFPLPIILALGLNSMRSSRLRNRLQFIMYMPHFISMVVLVGMVIQILNPRLGLYGIIYQFLHNGSDAPDILGSANSFKHLYVWSGIWQNMGWNSIIYVAALSSVDMSLHEAAQIDGANRLKRVIHIDFPTILPTATILLIMNAGNIMSVGFEKVYLMQNNVNLRSSEIISTYVYKVGLAAGGGNFSYATAIGLFNSVINLILLVTVNAVSKRISENSLW